MTLVLTRRRALARLLGLSGAAILTGLGAACGGPPGTATRGAATLVATALPTARPGGQTGAAPATPGLGTAVPTARPTRPDAAPRTPRAEVVIAQASDVTSLDPHLSTFDADVSVSFSLFDTLTFRDEDQSAIRPRLATEWSVQERRWRFRLRPGVVFHDGSPLTAADVKYSIERTFDPAARTAVASVFAAVERIETPDSLTVVFVMRQPDALLPARLASYGGQIVPKAYVERVGPAGFAARPIGSGPYRFVAWRPDDRVVLERVPTYWGGPAHVERLIFRPRPEVTTRVAELIGGAADLATNVAAGQLDLIARSGAARVEGALFNGLHVLAVNSRVPPLDRPLVKQALSLAIDREAIVRTIHRGQGVVPNGLIAQGDFGFDATLPPLEYSPARARQRLREAGYQREPLVLEVTVGYLTAEREMSELIGEMWRTVGITCRLEPIDVAERGQKTRDQTFKGLWWSDPASTVLDPDGMMYRLLGPASPQAYWRHPEWDRLGAEARSSLDQDLRLRDYRRMNEIALEHLPWIPVVQPRRLYGVSNRLDLKASGSGYVNTRRESLRPRV